MPTADGLDGARSLQDLIAALDRGGDGEAVLAFTADGVVSVGRTELAERSRRFAAWLATRRGARGRPIAIFASNGVEAVVARLAMILAEALCVPIDFDATPARLADLLVDSGTRMLFVSEDFLETARTAAALVDGEVEIILLGDGADAGAGAGKETWSARLSAPLPPAFGPADPGAAVAQFYTSGTTGLPKAVPLTHRHILTNLRILLGLDLVRPGDRLVLPLPLHHAYPLIVGLLLPLAAGAAVVLPAGLAGPEFIQAVREGRARGVIGVPRLYEAFLAGLDNRIASLGGPKGRLLSFLIAVSLWARKRLGWRIGRRLLRPLHAELAPDLEILACGGARLDAETEWRLEGLGYTVLTGYGLVETASIATFNSPGAARVGSAGRPSPAVEIRIVPVAGMVDGEVLFRGPIVFDGYAHNPEANAEAFAEGWFRTGDLGRLDADGFLHISGRIKEVIPLPDGKNVAPGDVEEVYGQSPFVAEIAVLERGGALAALVVPDIEALRGAGHADVAQQLRLAFGELGRGLPGYMRLADFAVTREPLPRNQLGKFKRFQLADIYERAARGRPAAAGAPTGADRERMARGRAKAVMAWLERRFPETALHPDTSLQMELDIDSLAWLDLGLDLQRELGVTLTEETMAGLIDVRDLIDAVESAGNAGGVGQATARQADARWLADPPPWARVCGRLTLGVARLAAGILFRLQTRGGHRLSRPGPLIVVANHLSDLDPLVLAAAIPRAAARRVWWGGDAARVFGTRAGRLLARVAQAFPVDDRAPDASLGRALQVLAQDRILVWFPEEWRSPDGRLQPFRAGIGRLVDRSGADVLIAVIRGTYEAMPRRARLPRPHRVSVAFGEALASAEIRAAAPPEPGAARERAIAEALHRLMARRIAGDEAGKG